MHISYGELVRTMPEGIRMLGYSYSQADDSAEAVIWTECVLARGYELLESNASAANAARRLGVLSCRSDRSETVLNLGGRPLFAFAARAADVAIAQAGQAAGSLTRIVDVSGTDACAYVAHRVARADNDAVVVAQRAEAGAVDLYLAPCGGRWLGIGRCIAAADAVRALAALGLSQVDVPVASLATKDVLVWASKAPDRAGMLDGFRETAGLPASVEAIDVERRLGGAIREGLEVESRRHRILTSLTVKIRLPSSERSRAQAG